MRQRPIGELVELLKNLGVRDRLRDGAGLPAGRACAPTACPAGSCASAGASRSQFLSAVLQVAPYARNEVQIDLDGRPDELAVRRDDDAADGRVRRHARADPRPADRRAAAHHRPAASIYRATNYAIEPDASNATLLPRRRRRSIPGAKVTVEGLGKRSLQGDVGFADVLHRWARTWSSASDFITVSGAETLEGIDVDLSDMPDTAQTLAVVALFAEGPDRRSAACTRCA